jgi:hypothetical protein
VHLEQLHVQPFSRSLRILDLLRLRLTSVCLSENLRFRKTCFRSRFRTLFGIRTCLRQVAHFRSLIPQTSPGKVPPLLTYLCCIYASNLTHAFGMMCYLDSPSRLIYNFCTSVQVFAVQLTSDHASRHKPLLLATCQLSRQVGSARVYCPAWVGMTGTCTLLDFIPLLKNFADSL